MVLPFMKTILNLSSKIHLGKNHFLLCFSPCCYRTKILLAEQTSQSQVIKKLTKQIDSFCKQEKILFSSFMFVSDLDKCLLNHLENFGYHKSPWRPTMYLDVQWRSFEEYLNSLKSDIRRKVIREIRCSNENGVTIEKITNLKQLSSALSDLSLNLLSKYKKKKRVFKPTFYENLSNYAKENVVAFIAKKQGNIIGFTLCLRKGKTLDAFQCGFNYDLQKKTDFAYFNLAYYTPIKWAIQENIEKIYYRYEAEKVKYKRGCKPEMQYTLVKCQNRLLNSQIKNYLNYKNTTSKTQ